MSTITQIGDLSAGQAKLSAVFLHGLGGNSHDTWSAGEGLYWPDWLAHDVEGLAVYPAAPFFLVASQLLVKQINALFI
jgi:hypothetical protein